jgi:hypothetical protein
MVQRSGRGAAGDHLRVYLDRVQPRIGGCYVAGVQAPCGNCSVEPSAWKLTLGNDYSSNGCANCTSLNNAIYTLDYLPNGQPTHGVEISNGCYWQSDFIGSICTSGGAGGPAFWQLRFLTGISNNWELQLKVGPVSLLTFAPIPRGTFNCLGSNTFTSPLWNAVTCTSASSATLAPAA